MSFIATLFRHLVTPAFCYYCRFSQEKSEPLCRACADLPQIPSSRIKITKTESIQIYGVSADEDPLKYLISGRNAHDYQLWVALGALMWRFMKSRKLTGDLLLPIDSIRSVQGMERTVIMAQQIAHESGIPVMKKGCSIASIRGKKCILIGDLIGDLFHDSIPSADFFRRIIDAKPFSVKAVVLLSRHSNP